MSTTETPYPRPPLALIVTAHEWVSLSVMTLFAPRGYAVLRSHTGLQALQRLREASVDLLIVDRDLKDMSGIDFCRQVRGQNVTVPVMLLSTGPWTRDEKLAALQSGAWDVCSLPMDSEELFLRLDAWVRAKLLGDQSRERGLLDPETGLYNAQGLLRRMAELGAGAVRHNRALACVVLAADLGDAGGDEPWLGDVVRQLSEVLRQTGRASDTIGRISPTEFVIVAPDTDPEGARGLAERLKRMLEASAALDPTTSRIRFGCSAVGNLRDASIAPTELLVRAAEALRAGNRLGDSIQVYDLAATSRN